MKESEAFPIEAIIERAVRGDATDAEILHLNAWRRAAPANERAFRDRERLIEATLMLRADAAAIPPRPTATQIITATRQRRTASAVQSVRRWGGWVAAAAAVIVLTIAQLGAPATDGGWQQAEILTGDAELATVKLPDGTVVRLAPSSRLRIEPGAAREVTLDGRAFFAVTRTIDGQPFLVHTAAATATVLGTRFELVSQPDSVRLVVMEGRVSLDAPENSVEVAAGEESAVEAGVALPARRTAAARVAPPWLGRFLVFEATPLRAASVEIERLYGVRVEVSDDALSNATITASFTDRTVDEVFDVVCAVLNASCTSEDGVVTVER
jgi:transmembrane sensor